MIDFVELFEKKLFFYLRNRTNKIENKVCTYLMYMPYYIIEIKKNILQLSMLNAQWSIEAKLKEKVLLSK